ncbi:MAG: hypothetical protein K2J81_07095 [Treponemataceae bacterium]|nr:hypothetical protein [Treponemataceae bacterium]
MDEFCEKLASIGIPALIFLAVMNTTGFAGAAAITTALAAFGGPVGMFGGVVALITMGGGMSIISRYGISKVMIESSKKYMKKNNLSKQEMFDKIDSYHITKSLKARIKSEIEKC